MRPTANCCPRSPSQIDRGPTACGPGFVPGAVRTALRIVLRRGWHAHGDPGQRILVSVGPGNRIAALFFQGPIEDAFLIEIAVLQVADPGDETDVPLHDRPKPLVYVGPVTGNARPKLRDEARM